MPDEIDDLLEVHERVPETGDSSSPGGPDGKPRRDQARNPDEGEPTPAVPNADDGRPARNVVAELERKNSRLEEQVGQLMGHVLGGKPEAEDALPHTPKELKALLEEGEADAYLAAQEANNTWRMAKQRESIKSELDMQRQAEELDKYVKSAMGNGSDPDWNDLLDAEVRALRKRFPSLPEENAKIAATMHLRNQASLKGSEEGLRDESDRRSSRRSDSESPRWRDEGKGSIDFDAPNRGFNEREQDLLTRYKMEHLMERGSTPEIENRRRASIKRIRESQKWMAEMNRGGNR
ncbi:MAG: hypothetical protein GY838_13625 [bacterium]|nr:hypothetical protein [bacterium]